LSVPTSARCVEHCARFVKLANRRLPKKVLQALVLAPVGVRHTDTGTLRHGVVVPQTQLACSVPTTHTEAGARHNPPFVSKYKAGLPHCRPCSFSCSSSRCSSSSSSSNNNINSTCSRRAGRRSRPQECCFLPQSHHHHHHWHQRPQTSKCPCPWRLRGLTILMPRTRACRSCMHSELDGSLWLHTRSELMGNLQRMRHWQQQPIGQLSSRQFSATSCCVRAAAASAYVDGSFRILPGS